MGICITCTLVWIVMVMNVQIPPSKVGNIDIKSFNPDHLRNPQDMRTIFIIFITYRDFSIYNTIYFLIVNIPLEGKKISNLAAILTAVEIPISK